MVTLAAMKLDPDRLRDFARRYTAARCSHNAASVAAFYSPKASLTINHASPAVGRAAITVAAQSFMTALPDLEVHLDDLVVNGDHAIYRWTLTGANTGPGGTGQRVRISGFEEWTIGEETLIAESQGYFDKDSYQHQLQHGYDATKTSD
jgi:predicted ester cyclase